MSSFSSPHYDSLYAFLERQTCNHLMSTFGYAYTFSVCSDCIYMASGNIDTIEISPTSKIRWQHNPKCDLLYVEVDDRPYTFALIEQKKFTV